MIIRTKSFKPRSIDLVNICYNTENEETKHKEIILYYKEDLIIKHFREYGQTYQAIL